MTALHPVLARIAQRHEQSLTQLSRELASIHLLSEPVLIRDAFKRLMVFLRTEMETSQDFPEERFLFTAIAAKANINAGGPMCMLFFDIHLASHPYERVSKIIGTTFRPTAATVDPHLRGFFEQNSPVCIPTADHLACRRLREEIETLLLEPVVGPSLKKIREAADAYYDIRRRGFEKVDGCLLPMTMALLNTDELNLLAEQLASTKASA